LKTNTIIGVEIVARVVHPKLGFLAPDQFLKGATEDDLLKLSELALESALAAKVHFHEMGVSLTPAINISAESLLRLPVSDIVLTHRMLFEGLTGVIFEIPERQFVSKAELIKARLPKLQRCGVSIAIDNFGRGPTHLDVLNQIPFSEIKIDRSIVENCAANASNAKMCKSFVQIAHNYGARATAVGISNDADFHKLREFGCDIGQGFLLGAPMQMEEIDALIAKFKNESASSAVQKAAPG
jgi:EAL domain-containing protein (putative c-di-GMP-specific phosphodiesterase class I)